MYSPTDRRPIASRERRVFIWLAGILVQWRISANAVSVSGMVFGILCGVAFYCSSQSQYWRAFLIVGAACCQLRLLCNMLDGMVAIQSGKASKLGELYNEIPDRVSDSFALVGFGMIAGSSPALGFSAALLAMFTAYIRAVGKCAGAPQAFHGPMAKPQRMFLITLASVYLAVSPTSLQPLVPGMHGIASIVLAIICLGCLITVGRRLNTITINLKSKEITHAASEQREDADQPLATP